MLNYLFFFVILVKYIICIFIIYRGLIKVLIDVIEFLIEMVGCFWIFMDIFWKNKRLEIKWEILKLKNNYILVGL